jgi:UDP-glucose 6-dehydrogenase
VSLSISVFGLGYVGSVTASGRSPIIEAGMSHLVAETNKACRLHATTDANTAVLGSH